MLEDLPWHYLPLAFIALAIGTSIWQFVRLFRLVAYEDYRTDIARRLLDRDKAYRVPKIYSFRRNGVLPADDPRYWNSEQDVINWVRNEAWKKLALLIPWTAIPVAMALVFAADLKETRDERIAAGPPAATATPDPNHQQTQSACARRELPAFYTAVADTNRDPRTPLVVPCTSLGTPTPSRP